MYTGEPILVRFVKKKVKWLFRASDCLIQAILQIEENLGLQYIILNLKTEGCLIEVSPNTG